MDQELENKQDNFSSEQNETSREGYSPTQQGYNNEYHGGRTQRPRIHSQHAYSSDRNGNREDGGFRPEGFGGGLQSGGEGMSSPRPYRPRYNNGGNYQSRPYNNNYGQPRQGGYRPRFNNQEGEAGGGYQPRPNYGQPRQGGYRPRFNNPEGGYQPREGGYQPARVVIVRETTISKAAINHAPTTDSPDKAATTTTAVIRPVATINREATIKVAIVRAPRAMIPTPNTA